MHTLVPRQTESSPPGQTEIEWQFDALDLRPVEAWLLAGHGGLGLFVAPGPVDEQADTYFDTPDWRFHRAGYALRVRRLRGQATAALKTLQAAEEGLRRRFEIEEALAGEGVEALLSAPGPVGERVRSVAGRQPLRALFTVHTFRRRYAVVLGGAQAAEVALDDTRVPAGGEDAEPFRLRRVEVEISPGALEALQPFVEAMRAACGLQGAVLGKFDLGLFAAAMQPAGAPDLGPTVVDGAAQPLGETAFAILRRHFAAFLAREPGTRLGDDPEELHDMRVAARRMRAAMRLFEAALPARAARLRMELRWIARALGEVRDLDVQLDHIRGWAAEAAGSDREALQPLAALMGERRAAARRRMLKALDSVRYERLLGGFTAMLRHGPPRRPAAAMPVGRAAPPLVARRYRKASKLGGRIGEASPAAEYHALRIECKKLRYALEFLREVYGKPARTLIARLVRLQDLLGLHQDACVAAQALREWSEAYTRRLPPQTLFVMGGLAERYQQQAAALRARFPEAFAQFKGRPWQRMQRAMEEAQAALPPRPAARPWPISPSPAE